MDYIMELIVSVLIANNNVQNAIGYEVRIGHVATLGEPIFPLYTVECRVAGGSAANGKLIRTYIDITSWSEKSFSEAKKNCRIMKEAILAAHPISDSHCQITLTPEGAPTDDSYSQSGNTPQSYESRQRFLLGGSLK